MLCDDFDIAGGSVTGRSHLLLAKANQDAYTWFRGPTCMIALVADGCGSGRRSEVGAELGARLLTWALAEALPAHLARGGTLEAPALWDAANDALLAHLRRLADAMGGDLGEIVSDFLLFTVVGLCITDDEVSVFSAGDGVFAINDEIPPLGPFPRNEPPYLSYGLLDRDKDPRVSPRLKVNRVLAQHELRSALLGTDGAADLHRLATTTLPGGGGEVGPLHQFWREDAHFQNRDGLRRRLARINRDGVKPNWAERRLVRERGLLDDDTTLVVVRRRAPR